MIFQLFLHSDAGEEPTLLFEVDADDFEELRMAVARTAIEYNVPAWQIESVQVRLDQSAATQPHHPSGV